MATGSKTTPDSLTFYKITGPQQSTFFNLLHLLLIFVQIVDEFANDEQIGEY